jgi:Exostosin family
VPKRFFARRPGSNDTFSNSESAPNPFTFFFPGRPTMNPSFGSSSGTSSSRGRRCASALAVTALLVTIQVYLVGLHLHSFLDLLVGESGHKLNKEGRVVVVDAADANDDTRGRSNHPDRSSRPYGTANRSDFYEPWIWNSSNDVTATAEGSCDPHRTENAAALQLNDETTLLSPCRHRPWIYSGNDDNAPSSKPPQVKILLTSYGWNHPNRTYGLRWGRSQRQQELLQAVVDHPLFDPKGWDEIRANKSAIRDDLRRGVRRYYVFLDVETCYEANYPTYLGGDIVNADRRHHRTAPLRFQDPCVYLPSCPALKEALRTNLFTDSQGSSMATLVYVECRGYGQPTWYRRRRNRTASNDYGGLSFDDSRIAMVALSSSSDQLDPTVDQGLAPPTVAQIALTEDQIQAIGNCEAETQRRMFLVFVGQDRDNSPRHDIFGLHNGSAGILSMETAAFQQRYPNGDGNYLLAHAVFAATPRGHNLFSYRFSEVLSAGSIPVVHSDHWVLPFRKELVDWTDCAVVIPESDVNRTIDILRRISEEKRCQMRQRCYEIYQRYMATAAGTIDGILQGLELVAEAKQTSVDGSAAR